LPEVQEEVKENEVEEEKKASNVRDEDFDPKAFLMPNRDQDDAE
jgi:hypothetical protein